MISGPDDIRHLAEVDREKNRVYVLVEGFLSVEQALELREAYRQALSAVRPGYTALTFFRDFKPGAEDVQEILSSLIELACKAQCRKTARVSSGSVLGPLQLRRLSVETATYPHRHCQSWEEAEAYLDSNEDE